MHRLSKLVFYDCVLFLNWIVNGRVENTKMIGIIVISREHLEVNKGVDGGKDDGESVKSDGLLGWCDVLGGRKSSPVDQILIREQ